MKRLLIVLLTPFLVLPACSHHDNSDKNVVKNDIKKDNIYKKKTQKQSENITKKSPIDNESGIDSIHYQNARHCLLNIGEGKHTSPSCKNMGNNNDINTQALNDLKAEGYLCDEIDGCFLPKKDNNESFKDDIDQSQNQVSAEEYNELIDEYNTIENIDINLEKVNNPVTIEEYNHLVDKISSLMLEEDSSIN